MNVSVCIANYKQDKYLVEAVASCKSQTYPNEICVFNDTEGIGSGEAFNRAIEMATGDIIVLLCADDFFTDNRVIADIVESFEKDKTVGYVSRFYYQFIDGDKRPVRAWRTYDPIEQANNPSGLAFRACLIKNNPLCRLSNSMFIEAPYLVNEVLRMQCPQWKFDILEYDTVGVRIHQSTAQNKDYYLKMWRSSPVDEWNKIGGSALLKDYTSLVQIKNNFKTSAVLKECWNFIRLRPLNLLAPGFYFYAIISLLMPRVILRRLPDLYRRTIGRWTTREIKRP